MLNVNDKGITKLETDFKLHSTRYLNTNNMHLYDEYGKIKKYNNVVEIIQEYYQFRIKYYTKRKLHKISKLEQEIKYLDAKVKFINDIIDNKLIVNNVKKSVIIEYLENNKYPKHEESYDYLIKMPIYNLTEEKRIELEKETQKKHLMLTEVKSKTEKDMWKDDLNILEKHI
jgi:DNA topoisomerase-2